MNSFTRSLTTLDDAALRRLIDARPDAFFPAPPQVASLATRLALPGSIARALRRLTAPDLALLERLADAGAEFNPYDATAHAGDGKLDNLRAHALVFGDDNELRIAPGVLSAVPAGWRVTDPVPENLDELMADISSPERKVLETLATNGGVGTTKAAAPDAAPDTPIATLIAKGLLVRVDSNTVRLPRPVRDVLRGHPARTFPMSEPPVPEIDQDTVDTAAATQGLDAVRQLRQLITSLLSEPIALNKDGSVGVRAQANLRKELGFDPALLITIGESAGLIGRGNVDDTDVLAATKDALTWLDATLPDQWAILLAGWAASPWRTDEDEKLLSPDMHSPDTRGARLTILRHHGDTERLFYFAPLPASQLPPSFINTTIHEAHFVGALDSTPAASTPLAALLDGADIAAATRELVPTPVDTLIAQADMTVLAPGPLEPEMGAFLERIADLESPGVASVWRITDASVRRGLDAGLTAEEIHAWLNDHVMGEVPQGIAFLIDDTARTHGSIRAGSAMSYLRSADPALITTAAEKLSGIIRPLAPTVAVSQLPLPKLMEALRKAGLQPTAEDETGAQLNMAPEPALVPATPSHLPRPTAVTDEQAEQIIARLRSESTSAEPAPPAAGDTIETLRAAARGKRQVTLGYVDKNGRGKTLTAWPLSVSAGQVDAHVPATDSVVRIALPRITKVVMA
ncbi:helicase-associated domain-containing protein [Corynebacterium sp. Marseille-P3884]|uniref:helicase-associated domain-containing protein n=1 Tax=Corynebacterium sp. Marseille-P3884 TaxID=2495409 RepID=UPI001B31AAB6|nr:helicase-associated domain-containing protein [Corynebacterium sp. Marseille-P3884]MBP3949359.1 helicase-associated domain-containing protein [Corynebacterium sp. Marseille-P3884]